MDRFDVIIIGAGIAGAGAAYFLAPGARVLMLEREEQPGYHSTGRSAALFSETYGNPVIRALAKGSRGFLEAPPAGFCDGPILLKRGLLQWAGADNEAALPKYFEEFSRLAEVTRLSPDEAQALVPVLDPKAMSGAIFEPYATDIDVNILHRGYLRHAAAAGAQLICRAEVTALARQSGDWAVTSSAGVFAAPVLINAAGAWADTVATMAGVRPKKIQPLRRTALTFDPPAGMAINDWPMVIDLAASFYFKPDAGRILASPSDETPTDPCDAQPDELDIALTIDRLETVSSLRVRRLASKWAGLRSFAPDRWMVAGFDPDAPGFFWLAGQGGYGIKTSPAMGRIAAALIGGGRYPADLADFGATETKLSPARFG